MRWAREEIVLRDGSREEAIAPTILSASRATDVPAFYADWFWNRIRAGYFRWANPFNARQTQAIATSRVRAVVFWSKNPGPLTGGLDELDRRGIHYYFQYTLNDYEAEGYEPGVPRLAERIETFRRLADRVGPERVVWRMDPLLRTERTGIGELLGRADRIAAALGGHTRRLTFSYADVEAYGSVKRNLGKMGAGAREFTGEEMDELARGMAQVARSRGIPEVATCGEARDQTALGAKRGRCVDDELMIRLWPDDGELMKFLGHGGGPPHGGSKRPDLKDRGQREECGCIASKDVGRYGTCPHLCVYCYANHSRAAAARRFRAHDKEGEFL